MMEKIFFLILVWLQVSKGDLFDDARDQLDLLGLAINGSRDAAKYELEDNFLQLRTWGNEMDNQAQTLFITQRTKIQQDLDELLTIGATADVDISPCFEGAQEYLDRVLSTVDSNLKTCLSGRYDDGNKTLSRAESLIDSVYDLVVTISDQLLNCNSETCVSPILDFIGQQLVDLPQKIDVEIVRVEGLYDLLKVAIDECQQFAVAQYALDSTSEVNNIAVCASDLIDQAGL